MPLAAGETVVAGEDFELAGGIDLGEGQFAGWPDLATNPDGETLFVFDTMEDEISSKSGRIVDSKGQISDEFLIDGECSYGGFGYEPASATWNSTNEEWLVVWSLDNTESADLVDCPTEGERDEITILVGQIVGRDGALRGTNFVISETYDGSPQSDTNHWDDIEHVHARWSRSKSAYLVTWKAEVEGGSEFSERVWATAIDGDGLSLTAGTATDVSGEGGSDDGVSLAYSETSDVFITVFSVNDNDELPGARLMELVPFGSLMTIEFTTEVLDLHGLSTDGDGSRGGSGAPTVAWDSLRDEFGVRWRAEDMDGNRNQQHFNVVSLDGTSSATPVKILSDEEFDNGGRVGVAYNDVADEWVFALTMKPTEDSDYLEDQLGMASMDAGNREDITPTLRAIGSDSVARPNLAYLADGCSVYTWWEFGSDWEGDGLPPEAAWAHIECFKLGCPEAGLGSSVFEDVAAGRYYDQAIGWMHEEGLTSGTTATTFAPGREATRAEVATFMWRQAGSPEAGLGSSVFEDVAAGRYYDQAIGWMFETGNSWGTTSVTFEPDRTASRAEVITFLWRDAGSPEAGLGSSVFEDVAAGRYYDQAIGWASDEGLTTGTSATTFNPARAISRGEVAAFFGRLEGCT